MSWRGSEQFPSFVAIKNHSDPHDINTRINGYSHISHTHTHKKNKWGLRKSALLIKPGFHIDICIESTIH